MVASLCPNCRPMSFCWPVRTSEEYNKNSGNAFTYRAKQRFIHCNRDVTQRHLWILILITLLVGSRSHWTYEGNNKKSSISSLRLDTGCQTWVFTPLNIKQATANASSSESPGWSSTSLEPSICNPFFKAVTLAFLTTVFATPIFRMGADDAICKSLTKPSLTILNCWYYQKRTKPDGHHA